MQQKLCLWMAVVVLFGALCVGNPFLAGREGQKVASSTGAAPSAVRPSEEANAFARRGDQATPAEREPASIAAVPPRVSLASEQPRIARATEAGIERSGGIELASLSTNSPSAPRRSARASALGELRPELECPDETLRAFVVRTELHDGVVVWLLVDGRRLRRNPKTAAGEPLLVPFVQPATEDRPE